MTMANTNEVKAVLSRLGVETPSWAYGNSGTRFKVFGQPGFARGQPDPAAAGRSDPRQLSRARHGRRRLRMRS